MTSPYHFAPLGPAILHSPWENGPDHGRPHEDGLCGEIRVRWRTETPTLIAGARKDAQGRATFHKLRNADDGETLAIPGATLRGALRNILEIVTSARMIHTDATAHYAVRDTTNPDWRRHSAADECTTPLFLRQAENGAWEALRCKHVEIQTEHLIDALQIQQALQEISDKGAKPHAKKEKDPTPDLATSAGRRQAFEALTVEEKYALLGPDSNSWQTKFALKTGQNGRPFGDLFTDPRLFLGLPVLSGPDPLRFEAKHKKKAYIFYAPDNEAIRVAPTLMQRFLAIYGRVDSRDAAAHRSAWGFWANKHKNKQTRFIPVFFIHHGQSSDQAVQALSSGSAQNNDPRRCYLAMSRMPKIPYAFSPTDLLAAQRTDAHPDRLDFVQALFGHVPPQAPADDNPPPSQRAWKGRVFFDWAELSGKDTGETPREGLTMGPKPSFWPYYLKPKGGFTGRADYSAQANGGPGVELAGWKRYPVRGRDQAFPQPAPLSKTGAAHRERGAADDDAAAAEQVSHMSFRKAGATFVGAIRLHNLLPVEVGALIWAITLGTSDGVGPGVRRHSIGRGKAQGHGQTSAEIVELTLERNKDGQPGDSAKHYLDLFEQWLVEAWNAGCGAAHRSVMDIDAVADLLSMSNPAVGQARLATLVYPDGTPRPGTDETPSLAGHRIIKERAAKGERALAPWPREPKPKT